MRRLDTIEGAFCRSCGLAIGRQMQNRTLITGWWGPISFFWNFVVIARNATSLRRHAQLPVPQLVPRQLPPGEPTWRRPGLILSVAIVPALVLVGFLTFGRGGGSPSLPQPGQCVRLSSLNAYDLSHPPTVTGVVDCTSQHDGKVVARNADGTCAPPADTYMDVAKERGETISLFCVDTTQ